MDKLKPCPFCGETSVGLKYIIKSKQHGLRYWIICPNCKVRTRKETDPVYVVDTWNRRVLQTQDVPDANVGDTISRQAAIDCFWNKERYFRDALDVIKDIRRLPSAQPEVIRCKDCKYYKLFKYDGVFACHYVIGAIVQRNSDDFCSRAKRRTDGD